LENTTTHSLHGLRHTHPSKKTKGYIIKQRYQQTRRDKQKTPQIMNDQLDSFLREYAAQIPFPINVTMVNFCFTIVAVESGKQ
jgi:hypothetical protein